MPAYLTRDGGGPPEATRNELLLREAVDRLRHQLDAARQVMGPLRQIIDAYKDLPATAWPPGLVAATLALATFEQLTKETTP